MYFFFQAEDGIRDGHVTGVQTCALPISAPDPLALMHHRVQLAAQVLQIPALRICEWALARTIEALLWQLETFTDPARRTAALGDLHQAQIWYRLAYG